MPLNPDFRARADLAPKAEARVYARDNEDTVIGARGLQATLVDTTAVSHPRARPLHLYVLLVRVACVQFRIDIR